MTIGGTNLDAGACFREHAPRVYRWALALCRRHDAAADITQEVFLRLLRAMPTVASDGQLRGWLRRTTVSRVVDGWRAERARRDATRRSVTLRDDAVAPADEIAQVAERDADLRAALAMLSEQQRLVVVAKCYDSMTFAEIATELGVAIPTVKTHYLRALATIRDRLDRDAEVDRTAAARGA